MLNKKWLFFFLGLAILFYTVCWKYSDIYRSYLVTFKKSGLVVHFNLKGQLDGENDVVTNGIVETEANFLDGKKDGWTINYYKTGKLKDKTFFRYGKANGPSYQYYESGKLKYKCNYRNDKRFGDLNWYLENGKLDSYAVYNIKGESFCSFEYDNSGKIKDMRGLVVSPDIFSFDTNYSVKLLNFNLEAKEGYHGIRDLYFVVATPPDLNMNISVKINDKLVNSSPIIDNCVKVPNAFTKPGVYKIFIESHLLDTLGKIVNGINIESIIKKE